ncbi:MAG: hypothetical protein ABI538_08430 [Pseudoxanthomonas sp.]
MKRTEITPPLQDAAFDFLYWFSRFEFGLKEKQFLKSTDTGKKAEPNWDRFVKKYRNGYAAGPGARALIAARPRQQVVVANAGLAWKELQFEANEFELQKVTLLLRLVRNNLFHGGRNGDKHWDNPEETVRLLRHSKTTLDELAEMGGFGNEYRSSP